MNEAWAAVAWRRPELFDSVVGSSTCLETLPHSYPNPAHLWAPSVLDLWRYTSPFYASRETISSVQRLYPRILVFRLCLPSHQWLPIHQTCLPVSCPACPGRALTWHCPLSSIWCPKENEIFQKIPKKRIIALDLEVDAESKCKPFSLAVSQIHSENLCSHLAVAHFLIPGSGLPGTGCDAKVFLLFVLVVIVAPSAVLHSP